MEHKVLIECTKYDNALVSFALRCYVVVCWNFPQFATLLFIGAPMSSVVLATPCVFHQQRTGNNHSYTGSCTYSHGPSERGLEYMIISCTD